MHSRELIELAGTLAIHAPLLVRSPAAFRCDGLDQYWVASKCRMDRWGLAMAKHATRGRDRRQSWRQLRPVVEEILVSEVLTRVWTALCCSVDRAGAHSDYEIAPVAQNVFAGHLEASGRAMKLIAEGQGMSVEEAVAMNRLRRRNERWNDLLLTLCADCCDIRQFAHCPSRVRDVAGPSGEDSKTKMQRSALMASLRLSYRVGLSHLAANAFSNRRIVSGILECIGSDQFDSTGLPNTRLVARLYDTTSDTQGMIDQLLSTTDSAGGRLPQDEPFLFRRGDDLGPL